MKNKIKLLGIIAVVAIIGFSFISCEDLFSVEDTVGTLTINGLSAYNGKNVIAYGYKGDTPAFMAAKDLNSKREVTYTTVSSGNASSMKVWKVTDGAGFSKFANFDGTNQEVKFLVVCIETRDDLRETNPDAWGVIGELTVNFDAGGTGVGNFTTDNRFPY